MPLISFLLLIVMVSSLFPAAAYSQEYSFERAMPRKMSETTVYSIVQDHNGFIWFATRDGLWRYDGYDTKEYRYNPGDVTSIGSSHIRSLYIDRNGVLWVGTVGGGLNKYIHEYDFFERFVYNEGDTSSLSHNDVLSIYQDSENTIWVCTEDGLNKMNHETGTFNRYYMEDNPIAKQLNRAMMSCIEDSGGDFWVGSYYSGLFLFDRKNGTQEYQDISQYMDTRVEPSTYFVWKLFEDSRQNMWIGTRGQGIVIIDSESGHKAHFHTQAADKNRRLSSNIVYEIFEDSHGNFWIGTANGLNIYDPVSESMSCYFSDTHNSNSISNDEIWAITQDKSGVIWLGGWEGFADKWDPLSKRFTPRISAGKTPPRPENYNCMAVDPDNRFLIGTDSGFYLFSEPVLSARNRYVIEPGREKYLDDLYIPSILCDSDNNTWVASNRGLWRYKTEPSDAEMVMPGFFTALYQDSRNTIWLGTQNGLIAYQNSTDNYVTYESTPFTVGSLSHKHVTSLYEDQNGVLWVGTINGLNRLNLSTNSFTIFRHNHNDASSLPNGIVRQIFQDSRGMLWVGTTAGLSCAVDNSGKFRNFSIEEGLAGNSVSSIFEDGSGNIWVATNEGVSKLLIDENDKPVNFENLYDFNVRFINYDIRDGLLDMSFRAGSFFQFDTGEVLLGGVYGISSFYPDSIKVNPYQPPVVLTGLKIMNAPYKADPSSKTLRENIEKAERVILNHKQVVITIEYVALSFTNSDNNQYAYMLTGFDDDWVEVGSQRSVTYTNLNPGEYIFKVRASNSDGIWNTDGASIIVKVLPPPWLSWPAFLIYSLLSVVAVVGAGHLILSRQKEKSRLKLEKMETEKIREMDYFKNIFFTNISHEFRTPLTLIISPLKEMLEFPDLPALLKKQTVLIYKNSLRLLKLINQLLEISKIEAGHIRLNVTRGDIVGFTRSIYEAFYYKAEESEVSYNFHSNTGRAFVYFDSDKIEKIMYNLLSNAFKNTPEGGSVDVSLFIHENQNQTQEFEIVVQDNGKGISVENQKKIFERFYAFNKDGNNNPSTGIGLSLSNQLAIIHKGSITLESSPGKGARFTLRIPASFEDYSSESVLSSAETIVKGSDDVSQTNLISSDNLYIETTDVNHEALVLLVEDNEELRQYIAERLAHNYNVITASDGREGLDLAVDKLPDIIVSDVMMPRMDGFELCQAVKEDERTSHIPVILLTAKVNNDSKIEGYESGADDYIPKPFEINHLIVRIKNLIKNRNMLRQLFGKGLSLSPGAVNIPSMEQKFIRNAINSVETHMDDPSYNVDVLCQDIGMSRSQVFRKLKALTDYSPVEFIRMLRIKRAAQIILQNSNSISEIAYMVGFSDIDYFRKCFKSQFGVTPSRYPEKESNNQA